MKVICCQLNIVWENKLANHVKVTALLRRAAPPEGSLIIFPEMFATGFSMNVAAITDSASHQTEEFLARMAADYRVFILGGVVNTGSDGRGRNECIAFSPAGAQIERYCKLHPFTFGGEAEHYTAGCDIKVFHAGEFSIAPFICYDLRFPEIFRAAVRRGANLFVVIANWPTPRDDHWTALLKARAIENQAYAVGVNRCGNDPRHFYLGHSVIFDPRGHIVAEAGTEEGIISADLDLPALIRYRQEFPVIEDMRVDEINAELS
ncbi:MAG: carbon-nitrogen family hydrolase [Acidobacteriota bacterium]|nr:carbon-nitrogen family hydrolase [Acidobacteriota bacterium]